MENITEQNITEQNISEKNRAASTGSASRTRDIILVGVFAALIAVCSWISIPGPVPFTLQTFAVFLAVALLGGKRGILCVLVYLLLGLIGVPVFAGFGAGPGKLLGLTGGYLLGFLPCAGVMWAMEGVVNGKAAKNRIVRALLLALSMLAGLLVCYAFGTAWFVQVYAKTKGAITVAGALSMCVFPFLPFDLLKIALAVVLTDRLRRFLPD
ncbi:MAG: biotin transporter BioY [Lachnospiraceae bacterium]|nr:biotin transporter BioY [Lachnospiraceae bacterium]